MYKAKYNVKDQNNDANVFLQHNGYDDSLSLPANLRLLNKPTKLFLLPQNSPIKLIGYKSNSF